MVRGEKRRLWIPEALAYKGQRDGPKGMLVFDVDARSSMPNRAPSDVKAPPGRREENGERPRLQSASRPDTGAPASEGEQPGHGALHRLDDRRQDVRQLGRRGEPTTFPLDGVITGWTEGVALMVEGEKTRFWIPEKLAYDGKQAPYGMLVFDVELIKIE